LNDPLFAAKFTGGVSFESVASQKSDRYPEDDAYLGHELLGK
jgi:hypothetical protein